MPLNCRLELFLNTGNCKKKYFGVFILEQRLGQSYLNNTTQSSAWNTLQTSTEPDSSVSLERSSRTFDQQELALLNEVRRLRQKLAIENRNKKPPVNYDST